MVIWIVSDSRDKIFSTAAHHVLRGRPTCQLRSEKSQLLSEKRQDAKKTSSTTRRVSSLCSSTNCDARLAAPGFDTYPSPNSQPLPPPLAVDTACARRRPARPLPARAPIMARCSRAPPPGAAGPISKSMRLMLYPLVRRRPWWGQIGGGASLRAC